jgi:hypothetical protein
MLAREDEDEEAVPIRGLPWHGWQWRHDATLV